MTEEDVLVTADEILNWIKEKVQNRDLQISPLAWVNIASKLNILSSDEVDKLAEFEQSVAKLKVQYMEDGMSATAAKINVEASDIYKDMRKQRSKITQIEEAIRLAKHLARLKSEEMQRI